MIPKLVTAILVCSLAAVSSAFAQSTQNILKKISSDDPNYMCGITAEKFICWGAPSVVDYLQFDTLPQISSPRFLDTAMDVGCVASESDVACAALSIYSEVELDQFIKLVPKNISQVEHLLIGELPTFYSTGRWYGCVATTTKLICWGSVPQETVDLLNKSIQFPLKRLTAAGEQLCVLDALKKVYCVTAENSQPGIHEKFSNHTVHDFYSGGEVGDSGFCIQDDFAQIFCEREGSYQEERANYEFLCDGGQGPCYVAILPTASEVQVFGSELCALTAQGRECYNFLGEELASARSPRFQRSSSITQDGRCAINRFGEVFCEKKEGLSLQEKLVFVEDEGHFLGLEKIIPRTIFKVDGSNRFCFYTDHTMYSYICGVPDDWNEPKTFAFLQMENVKKVASFGDVDCALKWNGTIECYNFTGESPESDGTLKTLKAIYDSATNAQDIIHGCVRYADRIKCMAKDVFGNLVPNVMYTNGSLFSVSEVRQWLRWQDSLCVLLYSGAVTCFNQTGITHQWHEGTFLNPRQLVVFRYETLSWDENTYDLCLSHDKGVECIYTQKNALNFVSGAENILVGDLNAFGCAKLYGKYKCWGEAYFKDSEIMFSGDSIVFLQESEYPSDTMMCSYSNMSLKFKCAFNDELGASAGTTFSDLLGIPVILRDGFGIL